MTESDQDSEDTQPTPAPIPLTFPELRKLEEAAEAGDLAAQRRLAEANGVASYEEYKQVVSELFLETKDSADGRFASTFKAIADSIGADFTSEMQRLAAGLPDFGISSADIEKDLKQATDGLDDNLWLDAQADLLKLQTMDKALDQSMLGSDPASSVFATIIYPGPEERMADELAENTRVNREILDEMRNQNREKVETNSMQHGEPLRNEVKYVSFDILDAATERCISNQGPQLLRSRRIPVTTGSVAYYLYENELGYLGKITIHKTGEKKSEIEVFGPALPEDQDVIQYYYHGHGWRIEDGSYHVHMDGKLITVHESELIPLAKELQQKRQKYLMEVVIPAYFDALSKMNLEFDEDQILQKQFAKDAQLISTLTPRKQNAQIFARAMIWRDLLGWMKLGNIAPSVRDCIAELKKKPAYRNKNISTKRMQKILDEGFAGAYEEILKNI